MRVECYNRLFNTYLTYYYHYTFTHLCMLNKYYNKQ